MKKIGIKIVVMVMLLYIFPNIFPGQSTQRLWMGAFKRLSTKPISLVPTDRSMFASKKGYYQDLWEKVSSLKSIFYPEKIQDRLPSLSISPIGVGRMTFTLMTGIPTFAINFTAWASYGKKLFSKIMGKKLIFTQVYQKNLLDLKQSDKDKLLVRLEKLANLSISEKKTKQYEYEAEVSMGKEPQAEAWLFGSTYRDAIHDAETIDDLALLYEAATTWLRLRIESGLYDDVANLEIEFDRIDQQVEKIMDQYDEQSIPVAKQYVKDMRQDLKDKFVQWLDDRQKVITTDEL